MYSQITIDAHTWTFKDLTVPSCGTSTHWSTSSKYFPGIPSCSDPSSNTDFFGNLNSDKHEDVALCSIATIVHPSAFFWSKYSWRWDSVTCISGKCFSGKLDRWRNSLPAETDIFLKEFVFNILELEIVIPNILKISEVRTNPAMFGKFESRDATTINSCLFSTNYQVSRESYEFSYPFQRFCRCRISVFLSRTWRWAKALYASEHGPLSHRPWFRVIPASTNVNTLRLLRSLRRFHLRFSCSIFPGTLVGFSSMPSLMLPATSTSIVNHLRDCLPYLRHIPRLNDLPSLSLYLDETLSFTSLCEHLL